MMKLNSLEHSHEERFLVVGTAVVSATVIRSPVVVVNATACVAFPDVVVVKDTVCVAVPFVDAAVVSAAVREL